MSTAVRLVRPASRAIVRRTDLNLQRGDLVKGERIGYWVVELAASSTLQPEERLELLPYELIENEYGFIAHYPVTFPVGRVCYGWWLKDSDSRIRWASPESAFEDLRIAFTAQFFEKVEL